ncbi:MAPEG family protein [Zavarzinia sp. CC-PAN008]|uniref:MAPEG family protein n=1 Tax=Zavarzinia sp. CC-PAN008 TaxID=3243332 RepID=UPI003F745332
MGSITMLWAGLCTLLILFLTFSVIQQRMASKVLLGAGNDPMLERRIRAHGNAVEYIPLGLVLLFLIEAAGWPGWSVHALGAALFLGRTAHGLGLMANGGESPGRFLGMVVTLGYFTVAAVLCLITAIQAL